jgi:hypothetical protein
MILYYLHYVATLITSLINTANQSTVRLLLLAQSVDITPNIFQYMYREYLLLFFYYNQQTKYFNNIIKL